jgi:hypothetical protein
LQHGSQQLGSQQAGSQHAGSQQTGSQQVGSQHDGSQQDEPQWRRNRPALASWLQNSAKATTANIGTRIFAFIGKLSCV